MATFGSFNTIERRVVDELANFSGEIEVPKYMIFFILQQIAKARCIMEAMDDMKEVYDSIICLRDGKRAENNKLMALNELIAETEEDISTKEAHVEIMEATINFVGVCSLYEAWKLYEVIVFNEWMTLSKNQRLIAELEALGEWGDAVRSLDHMREIVAHDSAKLGVLEQLLAGTHVGIRLKDGYVADMEEKESMGVWILFEVPFELLVNGCVDFLFLKFLKYQWFTVSKDIAVQFPFGMVLLVYKCYNVSCGCVWLSSVAKLEWLSDMDYVVFEMEKDKLQSGLFQMKEVAYDGADMNSR
ncbi:hypothetical protein Tco_0360587 [Tanacetum coccineum]